MEMLWQNNRWRKVVTTSLPVWVGRSQTSPEPKLLAMRFLEIICSRDYQAFTFLKHLIALKAPETHAKSNARHNLLMLLLRGYNSKSLIMVIRPRVVLRHSCAISSGPR